MKKSIYLYILLCLFPTFSLSATRVEEDLMMKKQDFIMSQAAQDILGNIDVWVNMKNTVDGASGTAWRIILGDKLPSQPVGIITVLAALPQDSWLVPSVCPRPFIEGTANDEEITLFSKRSMHTLESFIMVDPEKERIRKACLENIKKRTIK